MRVMVSIPVLPIDRSICVFHELMDPFILTACSSLFCAGANRGGLIKWADLVGPKHVAARLTAWAKHFESAGLSGFFKPCDYLAKVASQGGSLSAGISPKASL